MSSIEHSAYLLAVNQLARQGDDLKNLRSAAGFSAALNGLIVTFLATIFSDKLRSVLFAEPVFLQLSVVGWLSFSAFAGSLAFSILVQASSSTFTFNINEMMLLDLKRKNHSDNEIYEKIATDANSLFDENEREIGKVRSRLLFALLLGFIQIPLWIVSSIIEA